MNELELSVHAENLTKKLVDRVFEYVDKYNIGCFDIFSCVVILFVERHLETVRKSKIPKEVFEGEVKAIIKAIDTARKSI